MQNNTYPENRWFFSFDVCSTHRIRELLLRLVINVIGAWSNPVRMGVQSVNQFCLLNFIHLTRIANSLVNQAEHLSSSGPGCVAVV